MSDKATPRQPRPPQYHVDSAHAKQSNADDLEIWRQEIHDRIKEYDRPIDEYLVDMVPSNAPLTCCPPIGELLNAIPSKDEKKMYDPLVAALGQLTVSFPPDIRPTFYNYGHKAMKFPFELHEQEQHPTKPDVIATIPSLPVIEPLHRWRHVALVFELKTLDSDDPMIKNTITHWNTLVQLAKSARNIMLSQGRLYAFLVGIYGSAARIFRFDRAGAICSAPFKYKERPSILHQFLWRLFHPLQDSCSIVGQDPTIQMGTSADRQFAFNLAVGLGAEWERTAETRKAVRRITMTDEKGNLVTYLTFRLLCVNPGLFSRATLVWEAFRLDVNNQSSLDERYVIKEGWRQCCRIPETMFYQTLKKNGVVTGVALYAHGEDLGRGDDELRQQDVRARAEGTQLVGGDRKVGHLTISGFHNDAAKRHYNERSQMRISLHTVGTPLADFQCTWELIKALRDAIDGHRQAYELGGVIHRDISEGNVMMARHSAGFSGFIHDFDYSFSWRRFLMKRGMEICLAAWEKYCREHGHEPRGEGAPDESKERTGTVLFMAIEILGSEITHEARHDLESFYWLLIFILLRHSKHPRGKAAFGRLFGTVDWEQAAELKYSWIMKPVAPLIIPGNAPLNNLLEALRTMLRRNFPNVLPPGPHITHAQILAMFDNALAAEDWPVNDAAIPWVPPAHIIVSEKVQASLGSLKTKGTVDMTTATHSLTPQFTDILEELAPNGQPVDEETAFWQGNPLPEVTLLGQPVAGPSRTSQLATPLLGAAEVPSRPPAHSDLLAQPVAGPSCTSQNPLDAVVVPCQPPAHVNLPAAQPVAGPSRTSQLAASHDTIRSAIVPPVSPNQPLTLDVEAEVPDLVIDELPNGHTRARSTRRAESPEPPRRTGRATRKTAANRQAAETWPAGRAQSGGEEPARRYNLRSSNVVSTTVEATVSTTVEPIARTLPSNKRVMRSRSRAAVQTRTAVTVGSTSGKRSRIGEELDGLEENVEVQLPKRQRTLSRVRKPVKKFGSKP